MPHIVELNELLMSPCGRLLNALHLTKLAEDPYKLLISGVRIQVVDYNDTLACSKAAEEQQ
jgi:hypothetical protein